MKTLERWLPRSNISQRWEISPQCVTGWMQFTAKCRKASRAGPRNNTFKTCAGDTRRGPCVGNYRGTGGGNKTTRFLTKLLHMVYMAGDWRNDRDMVSDVLRHALDEWHTVEVADAARADFKKRPGGDVNGKSVNGGEAAANDIIHASVDQRVLGLRLNGSSAARLPRFTEERVHEGSTDDARSSARKR